MSLQIGDRVAVVEDIFVDAEDQLGCIGKIGTVVGFHNRVEVALDGLSCILSFDDFELELLQ